MGKKRKSYNFGRVILREDPFGLPRSTFGHCPFLFFFIIIFLNFFFGGGGLNACPDGLGHLFTATAVIVMNFLKLVPECPVECRRGGVTPIAIWAMPKCRV